MRIAQKSLVSFSLLLALELVLLQSIFAFGASGSIQQYAGESSIESSKSALSDYFVPSFSLEFIWSGSSQNVDSDFEPELKTALNQRLSYSAQLVNVQMEREGEEFNSALILKQQTNRLYPSHYFW